MRRRAFLHAAASAAVLGALGPGAGLAFAHAPPGAKYGRLLVLIELKGGNDGLNTVVPYADSNYYALRPKIAIPRDAVLPLSDRAGLHPSLAPLLPLWKDGRLAVLQGVGYPEPNLSHFRSIEIWDTASRSDEYLQDGWLARTFAVEPPPREFAADGVVVGSNDLGPLAGTGARVVALANTEAFLRRARLASRRSAARATRRSSTSSRSRRISCRPRRISMRGTHVSQRNFRRAPSAAPSEPRARSSRIPAASPSFA